MRFESVTARAFGPFQGESLQFAPGMTVVHGPNESGKSTWQAALYAGLCGMRRGRGMPSEDRDFRERHRPWKGDSWEVSLRLVLDDGRRVELRQELENRIDCSAVDLVLNRDLTSEIINDGAPDGSLWLGLNRRSFFALGLVRQAEILRVREEAGLLQEYLQRAADTGGSDATAAAAISAIQDFQRTQVGTERSTSVRPLRRAMTRCEDARKGLEEARTQHEEYLQLCTGIEQARQEARQCRRELDLARAARAAREADRWKKRLDKAQLLASRYPAGPPPLREDGDLAESVDSVLQDWAHRPIPAHLDEGPGAEDLRRMIDELPPPPEGDTEPHPEVLAAREEYLLARRLVEGHESQRPPERSYPKTGGHDAGSLRDLARELEIPPPPIDPLLKERLRTLSARREQSKTAGSRRRFLFGAAATAAVAGGLLLALDFGAWTVIGTFFLAALLALLAVLRGSLAERARILEQLLEVENTLGAQRHAREEAERRLEEARRKAAAASLPADPAALRKLAEEHLEASRREDESRRWTARCEQLRSSLETARLRMARALEGRNVPAGSNLDGALQGYLQACARRAEIAKKAERRQALEAQLGAREALERSVSEALERRGAVEQRLQELARQCGIEGQGAERLATALEEWRQQRNVEVESIRRAHNEWEELQHLLEGKTLEELESETRGLIETAGAAELDASEVNSLAEDADLDRRIEELQHRYNRLREKTAEIEGQLRERARSLPDVPATEEELAAAEEDLASIRRLEETLSRTLDFLQRAQERVHRDIAPRLATSVRQWLPRVTGDRYADLTVDPESLAVTVCTPGGLRQAAERLSHGTAEQVYFLLRIALAEHLTRPDESCPLILDDITAHWDNDRAAAALDILQEVSRRRQIILFSQSPDVLRWACETLEEPEDRLVRLEVVPVD